MTTPSQDAGILNRLIQYNKGNGAVRRLDIKNNLKI